MKLPFQIFIIIVLMLPASIVSEAQSQRLHTTNTNAWFMYFGNHKISNRIGWHAEVQLRRNDLIANPQQLLLRTGVDIYAKNKSRFTVGYAFIKTYPYGAFATGNAFPEHRVWQQFLTTQEFTKLTLSHRFRLEQRNIGNATTGEFKGGRFENRIRYMAKVTYPLTPNWRTPVFIAAYEEFMLNFGKEVGYNLFDQNRLYAAVGFSLSPTLKIEAGYLYQLVQLRSLDMSLAIPRNKIEDNHTFQVGVFSTLPFMRAD